MRVVVVAIGAVVLTGLMVVYQVPTLVEGLRGGTETTVGVSAPPEIFSASPGNAAKDVGAREIFEDAVVSSDISDKPEYVADSARLNRLRASLGDRSRRNRSRAAEALGKVGDRHSVSALERLARRDPSSNVRLSAVEALGELDATGALAEIVVHPDVSGDIKLEAIERMVDTNQELDYDSMTTDALLRALDDPNSDVYEAAADLLWGVDDASVAAAVWSRFNQHAQVDHDRAEVMLDLLESLDEEVDEARELLDDYDDVDWDEVVIRRQREAAAAGVCFAGVPCS
jgi:hypothetical protein